MRRLAFAAAPRAAAAAGLASAVADKRWGSAPACCQASAAPPSTSPSPFVKDWDKRHPAEEGQACQGATRVVLLVRHGQYEDRGGPGFGRLSDLGREQARLAGQHIVARMRASPEFKAQVLSVTSSALPRAVETADIMEREISEELSWVDVRPQELPAAARQAQLRWLGDLGDGLVEFEVQSAMDPIAITNDLNLLQPVVLLKSGSRVRISNPTSAGGRVAELAPNAEVLSIRQPLAEVRRPDPIIFDSWHCDGCMKMASDFVGNIHWSDEAEKTGLGFCEECFAAGPKHKKLKPSDTFARTTEGVAQGPLRRPHDKNLNEAGIARANKEVSSGVLIDTAVARAAFLTHMHRSVDHKHLKRSGRADTIQVTFLSSSGKEEQRHLTAKEFGQLELGERGQSTWIFDGDAKERVNGDFQVQSIGAIDTLGQLTSVIQAEVAKQHKAVKAMPERRQVEIFVIHQNMIRYLFLELLQFDTSRWLSFGGDNCAMTQLRIKKDGSVQCDFFAGHESKMNPSQYTFNKRVNP